MASELAYGSTHGGVAYPSLNHYYPHAAAVGGSAAASAASAAAAPANSAQQAFSPGTTNHYNPHQHQQQQQHGHGAAGVSSGGSMEHHQHQQQPPPQHVGNGFHFTSGPPPSRLAHQFHHQQPSVRNSTSPQPGAAHQPTPPKQYPMAAPPLPNTPNSVSNSNTGASPGSPRSPGTETREQQRTALLFDINNELLKEVNNLQLAGKGGAMSPQQVQQARSEGKSDHMASEEYIQSLRRLQANLAYLMAKAQPDAAAQQQQQQSQQSGKPAPGPAHMTAPPHMPQLEDSYRTLRDLFPGWQGLDHRSSSSMSGPPPASSPSANYQNGLGTSAPSLS